VVRTIRSRRLYENVFKRKAKFMVSAFNLVRSFSYVVEFYCNFFVRFFCSFSIFK